MNLLLDKKERESMGGKSITDIRSEIGKVTGKAADPPTMDSLRKRYGVLCWIRNGSWKSECIAGD